MKKVASAAIVAIILGITYLAYDFWQASQQAPASEAVAAPPAAPAVAVEAAAPPAAEPAILHPLDITPASAPLPLLGQSDQPVLKALRDLMGKKSLALFLRDGVIHRFVATVDNLPRQDLSAKIRPLRPAPGSFATTGKADELAIAPRNAARYASYIKLTNAVDSRRLVAVYRRFYPLFQQEYEALGYPKGYFNDRLVAAIDDLLAAPEPATPIKLIQPKVLYEYADPALQARSAGQKIMMRMGNDNAAKIKTWLREIRQQITQDKPEKP